MGASLESNEPTYGSNGGHTIWYRWEAVDTEVVTVGTCGSGIPSTIHVYSGNTVGALTEVAHNVWDWPGCSLEEGVQATFKAIAGHTYSIQIDGSTFHEASQPPISGEGDIEFQIRHREPPENDDFADAKPLQLDSLFESVANFGATKELGEPDHRGDQGGASVWFKFTAPRSGGVLIQVAGGQVGHDSLIAVYTGSSVDSLTSVPGNEVFGSGSFAFPVAGGVTYRIALDGKYDPPSGSPFMDQREIRISTFPGNDDFEDAWELPRAPLGGTLGMNGMGSVGATKQAGEPDHAGYRGGASVWFTWTSPASGSVQLSACGANFPTLLAVYTGSTVGELKPIAASINPQSPTCIFIGGPPGEVSFNVDPGTTYRIAVDGYQGAWGTFGIEMQTSTKRLPELGHETDDVPPQTKIVKRHVNRRRHVAVFHLRASEGDARILCKLDSRPFLSCGSTVIYRHLKPGRHTFRAKALSVSGLGDPTPALFRFRIPPRVA